MQEERCLDFVRRVMDVHSIFLASLIKTLLVKAVFSSYYLKFSLPMFLKCFLIFA